MTDYSHDPNYWLGYLSTLVAHAAADLPKPEKKAALKQLHAFLQSGCATPELVRAIKERDE